MGRVAIVDTPCVCCGVYVRVGGEATGGHARGHAISTWWALAYAALLQAMVTAVRLFACGIFMCVPTLTLKRLLEGLRSWLLLNVIIHRHLIPPPTLQSLISVFLGMNTYVHYRGAHAST